MALDFVPAQPPPPRRRRSFTDFQVANPTAPPPGNWLDSASDEVNDILARVIAWASRSLNSDGSLRPNVVSKPQLVSGLFEDVAQQIVDEVEPLVVDAKAAMQSARLSDASAARHADAAGLQALTVARAAHDAREAEREVIRSAERAIAAAELMAQAAVTIDNSANDSARASAIAQDYAVLAEAWAEHMPDTIPPNILAANDITGDHWSSRWWANRAHEIVDEETGQAICELQTYWMGVYPSPPTHTTCGDPVVAGALYYNSTSQASQVYDGTLWHNITQPVPGQIDEYLYLPIVPTTVFSGVDVHGNTMVLDPASSEIAVYRNGIKLIQNRAYTIANNSVTLASGAVAGDTVEIIALNDLSIRPPPTGVKVNTSIWVFDGFAKSFPLQDSQGNVIDPPGPVDSIVSIDGVIQQSGADYTTRTGWIDFAVAPRADASRWMVVGLPFGGGTTIIPADNISVIPSVAGASDVQAALTNIYARVVTIDAGSY